MGKSRQTYTNQIDQFVDDWRTFRRELDLTAEPHWDELMRSARRHADAAGQQNPRDSTWGVVFSIMLEQQRRIADLEAELAGDD